MSGSSVKSGGEGDHKRDMKRGLLDSRKKNQDETVGGKGTGLTALRRGSLQKHEEEEDMTRAKEQHASPEGNREGRWESQRLGHIFKMLGGGPSSNSSE